MTDWFDEQMKAAEVDADSLIAHRLNMQVPDDLAAVTHQLVEDAIQRWEDTGGEFCDHLKAPQPVFLFLSRPQRMLCRRCAMELEAVQMTTDEDFTCDSCRQISPDGMMRPVAEKRGPVTVIGGLCERCDPISDQP